MPIETEAIVVREVNGSWNVEKVTIHDETLAPSEVLIGVKASGICHSDISCMNGTVPWPLPAIFGHEGVGIVQKVGSSVSNIKTGDPVLSTWASCQQCHLCSSGHPASCGTWRELNLLARRKNGAQTYSDANGRNITCHLLGQSSLARHMIVDESSCVKVTLNGSFIDLAPFGCSAITGAGTVFNYVKPEPGSAVAVFGVGAVGASAIMGAALSPVSKIIAVDLHAKRLETALKLGATHTIQAGVGVDVVAKIKEITNGIGVDHAIECTGVLSCFDQAYNSLAKRGTVYVVGIAKMGSKISVDFFDLFDNSKKIIGCVEGDCVPQQLVPYLAEIQRQGKFDFQALCRRYSYKDANQAIQDMLSGEVIKPILVWDEELVHRDNV